MYPINHNYNDVIDTWYPSYAGLNIFYVDFHTFVANTYFHILALNHHYNRKTQKEHLAADHNFILADDVQALKQ